MDADESGYEAGSEASQTSSGSEISLTERKKPCEICGSNADDDKIMTCFNCEDTREHTYCSRVMKHHVPRIWICDGCFNSGRRVRVATNSRGYGIVPIRRRIAQTATSSRTSYQVVDSEVVHDHNMTTCESGSQAPQAHASPVGNEGSSSHVPMDTSPFKIPDLNLPSDSGSEI